nr:C-C chemokine receptor type 2 [Danio rerio]|eukprot:XP_001343879.1 C-C chemokine receptor type 2 [Danio rerio]
MGMGKKGFNKYYNYNETEHLAPPCNDAKTKAFSEVFLPILYSIVFIIGIIGNGLVVWVFIRCRQKSNMTDVCLLNLALSDLLFLVSLPFWAHNAMNQRTFGKFMCHTITGLFMIGLYASIFFMVLLTLDRYAIIIHPNCMFFRNRSAKLGLALLVWMLSLLASLPNIIFANEKFDLNHIKSCQPDFPDNTSWMSFTYINMNLLSLIFPLIILIFCYSRIISTLFRMKSEKKPKLVKLILAVVTVYFLFFTPYNIVIFLLFLQRMEYFFSCEWHIDLSLAMQWVETIALSHCCLNPIIYAFASQQFRGAVKDQFPLCFRRYATVSQQASERRSSIF